MCLRYTRSLEDKPGPGPTFGTLKHNTEVVDRCNDPIVGDDLDSPHREPPDPGDRQVDLDARSLQQH